MSLVSDIVYDRPFAHVTGRQTVADAARRMAELNCGAILVVDDGELRGVFSERDIMRRVVLEGRNPETTPVADVMSTHLSTIEESATLEEAMAAMQAHGCRHLPVMKGGRVVAFLSMRDVMRHELTLKTEELHHMRSYIGAA
ncbi:MAG TPA: CBS domain-containing protein [Bryobacteraceae bacterium]|nr:CBS domain-containing protein [Bryobacteraceae bacterium]